MTAAPIALLTDMVSAAAISTLSAARGLPNTVFFVSSRAALDRLFEPFDAGRPWPGRLVAFYSDVVVPQRYLDAMSLEPVNIHPAPPEYPGRRALEFALREGVGAYGVTAHVMTLPVDSGPILSVQRFPVTPGMTEEALRYLTWRAGFALMFGLMPTLAAERPLSPDPDLAWGARDCSEAAWQAALMEKSA
ncbi:formyltransferase family protein [Thalassobaculum sp.]|uniref:formyltransferase family protein n=1 Tax=Thalassobaculum sp. TaxID=2022740 RepID=UPI003B5CB984